MFVSVSRSVFLETVSLTIRRARIGDQENESLLFNFVQNAVRLFMSPAFVWMNVLGGNFPQLSICLSGEPFSFLPLDIP